MTIGKDVRLNHYPRANGPLNGKTASVDGWLYPLDDDSSPSYIVTHTTSSPRTHLSKGHTRGCVWGESDWWLYRACGVCEDYGADPWATWSVN